VWTKDQNETISIVLCDLLHRLQSRHFTEEAYQQKLLDACIGKVEFPKGRTFSKPETTTSNAARDFRATTAGVRTYAITLSAQQFIAVGGTPRLST